MKTNKLNLSQLSKTANVITASESLNSIQGGHNIPMSHGDEAGTGGGGGTRNPVAIPMPVVKIG